VELEDAQTTRHSICRDCVRFEAVTSTHGHFRNTDEIMLSQLKVLSDRQAHTKRELPEKMADHFGLTPEEREPTHF